MRSRTAIGLVGGIVGPLLDPVRLLFLFEPEREPAYLAIERTDLRAQPQHVGPGGQVHQVPQLRRDAVEPAGERGLRLETQRSDPGELVGAHHRLQLGSDELLGAVERLPPQRARVRHRCPPRTASVVAISPLLLAPPAAPRNPSRPPAAKLAGRLPLPARGWSTPLARTDWPPLAQAGRGWRRLAAVGAGWPRLAQAGRGWRRLAAAGAGWPRLAQVGRGWRRLAAAGADWPRLAQAGRGWRRLAAVGAGWPRLAQVGRGWRRLAAAGADWPRLA